MAKSFPLAVKPSMLQWARNRAGLEVPELAKKMHMNSQKLQEWESGKGHPTYHQARDLAKKTHLPFGYLFFDKPVDEKLGIADFRTLPGKEKSKPSVDLLEVVRTARFQQSWFREYLITERDLPPLSCFQDSPETDEDKIARQIRSFFNWDELQFKPREENQGTFLQGCIDSAHDKGFLISLNGKVGDNTHRPLNNKEFRGFAMFDEYAPLIFINTKQDSPHAQLFTLAHELAHLFRRKSGIDSAKWEGTHNNIHAEEAACNRIAASALMPDEYFNERWVNANGDERQKIEKMSRIFKVSKMATAIRAFDTQNVSKSLCNAVCAEEKARYEEKFKKPKDKKTSGGPEYPTLLYRRLPGGERFARAVLTSVRSGNLRHTNAFGLLGVSQENFYNCVKRLGW